MLTLSTNTENLRSLSQIFSPSNFSKIIREGDLYSIEYRIQKHITNTSNVNYSSVLKFLYKKLEKDYRNEYVYKNAIINKKLLGTYSLNTTTVLNEFRIGDSVADFIMLNGEMKLFEIKTELDSLEKLEKQISSYKKFANKIYIVANPAKAKYLLNKYTKSSIGIIEYSKNNTLRTLKSAQNNYSELDHTIIFKTLRKAEYLKIIKAYFNVIPDVPNTKIFQESLALIKTIEIRTFQTLAIEQLKTRKLKCPDLLKSNQTPKELKHVCYTLNFSKKEYFDLYRFLNKKM